MVPRHVDVKGNRKAAPVFCSFFLLPLPPSVSMSSDILSQCCWLRFCYHRATYRHNSITINWFLQVLCRPAQRLYTTVSFIIHTPAPPPSQKQSRFNFYVAWGSLKVNELRVHVRFYSLTSSCSSTAVATWSSPVVTPGEVQALTLLLTNAARLWALSLTFSTT